MNAKLVTVARFTDYMEAELAKQLLEDEGLVVFVMDKHGAAYTGIPGIVSIVLQTPESQANEARKILEASKRLEESDQESEEEVEHDWDEDANQEQDEDLEQE